MHNCPRCKTELTKFLNKEGFFWDCLLCSGRAVSMAVIRKLVPRKVARELWNLAVSSPITSDAQCPFCRREMTGVALNIEERREQFDICKFCSVVWFDRDEFSSLPEKPPPPPEPELSLEARKALAFARVESIRHEYEKKNAFTDPPDYWWEYILGFLGLPVEYNSRGVINQPLVTWSLSAFILSFAITTFPNLDTAVEKLALIPNDFTRYFGLTFISSFLLHGGWMHLLGNLYFLLVFGDNVEDVLGPFRFAMLIFFSSLAGDIGHIMLDPSSSTPVIGASGGISGIIAFYCLSFPNAKVGLLWWFRWFRIPVGWMFFFWIAMQVFGAVQQASGFGDVSYLAHLGGAVIGLLFWWSYSNLMKFTD